MTWKNQWKMKLSVIVVLFSLVFAPLSHADGSDELNSEVIDAATSQSQLISEVSVDSQLTSDLNNKTTVATAGIEDETGTTATTTTEIDISSESTSGTENETEFDLNTGRNEVGSSTVISSLDTGDIESTVNLLNLGNSQLGEGSSFASQNIYGSEEDIILFAPNVDRIDISYGQVNPDSATNILENNNVIHVFEQSDTSIDNTIDIDANTGENNVEHNTVIDNIATGNIDLGVNLINLVDLIAPGLQLTVDVWNILGDLTGDILIGDWNGLDNQNEVSVYNSADIEVSHNTDVSNYFDLDMNTGENEFARNTVVGEVTTGEADARTNVANISDISAPMFFLLNVFGEWDGNYGGLDPDYTIINVVAPNAIHDVTIGNDFSYGSDTSTEIDNTINIRANTGKNLIKDNTMVGRIQTGDIKIAQNVINIFNSVDKNLCRLRLGIINIFGNWKHKDDECPVPENPPVNPEEEIVPASEDEPPAVLGETRIVTPALATLPAAGADLNLENINLSPSLSANMSNRSPIWALPILLLLATALAFIWKKRLFCGIN